VALRERLVQPEPPDQLDLLAPLAPRDRPELKDLLVLLAEQVRKDCQAILERLALKVTQEHQEYRETLASSVLLEHRGYLEQKDRLVYSEPWDNEVQPVPLEPLDRVDPVDLLARPVTMEQLAVREEEEAQDLQAIQVTLDLRVNKDSRV